MKTMKKGREGFQVVDGPLAGRKFRPGRTYSDDQLAGMATADLAKFETVKEKTTTFGSAVKTGKGGNKS